MLLLPRIHLSTPPDPALNSSKNKNNFFKDVSLFAAANLLFPSAKVMTVSEFFLPADAIMLGNITTDYKPVDIGDLPPYC